MRVEVILRHKGGAIFSIDPTETIQTAADRLAELKVGALFARRGDGAIEGVLSERDIVRGIARDKAAILNKPVSELMTRLVVTCAPTDTLDAIMDLMTERRVRHIPVLDGETLLGVISIGDVVKHRMTEMATESDALRQYIAAG